MTAGTLQVLDVPPPALLLTGERRHTAASIMDAWHAGKSPNTLRSYEHDLRAFARFLSDDLGITPPLTIEAALERPPGPRWTLRSSVRGGPSISSPG